MSIVERLLERAEECALLGTWDAVMRGWEPAPGTRIVLMTRAELHELEAALAGMLRRDAACADVPPQFCGWRIVLEEDDE